jgi:hypothetical protein
MAAQVPNVGLSRKLRDLAGKSATEPRGYILSGGQIGLSAREFSGKFAFLPQQLLG